MKIKYLMRTNVKCLSKEDSIYDACLLMYKYKQYFIPVIDDILVGVIEPIDIIKFYAKYKTLNFKVKNAMNKRFHVLTEQDSLEEASELFNIYNINTICITNSNKLMGLLSIKDLTYDDDLINLAYNAISNVNIM